jgi:hypothetical protein
MYIRIVLMAPILNVQRRMYIEYNEAYIRTIFSGYDHPEEIPSERALTSPEFLRMSYDHQTEK